MARGSVSIISRWHPPIDGFNTSALDFCAAVEAALRAREIPEFSVTPIDFKEAGGLAAIVPYSSEAGAFFDGAAGALIKR